MFYCNYKMCLPTIRKAHFLYILNCSHLHQLCFQIHEWNRYENEKIEIFYDLKYWIIIWLFMTSSCPFNPSASIYFYSVKQLKTYFMKSAFQMKQTAPKGSQKCDNPNCTCTNCNCGSNCTCQSCK